MNRLHQWTDNPNAIFLFCLIYALHMVEEFTLGFVEWADRYFGRFNWTQNLIGNTLFMLLLAAACYFYSKNPVKNLWLGMAGAMWILTNAGIHLSATLLGGEYSPGVVTAVALYLPGSLWFLIHWGRQGRLNGKNLALSFAVGGVLIMLLPTFARAVVFQAQLARLFHLIP